MKNLNLRVEILNFSSCQLKYLFNLKLFHATALLKYMLLWLLVYMALFALLHICSTFVIVKSLKHCIR